MPTSSPGLMPLVVIALPAGLALFWGLGGAVARAGVAGGLAARPRLRRGLCRRRMAARPSLHGISLERLRLCADAGTGHDAVGRNRRTLGPDACRASSSSPRRWCSPTLAGPAAAAGTIFLAGAATLLLAHIAYGALRLSVASESFVPDVRIRVVQPSINQNEKWVEENADAIFKRYLELSDSASSPERTGGGQCYHPRLARIGAAFLPDASAPMRLRHWPRCCRRVRRCSQVLRATSRRPAMRRRGCSTACS